MTQKHRVRPREGKRRKEDYIKWHHKQGDYRVYYICTTTLWPEKWIETVGDYGNTE